MLDVMEEMAHVICPQESDAMLSQIWFDVALHIVLITQPLKTKYCIQFAISYICQVIWLIKGCSIFYVD